jgi:hypothetical protein
MSYLPQSNFEFSYFDTKNSTVFDNVIYENRLIEPYSPYRYGSFYVYQADNKSMNFQAAVWLNVTSQDVGAIYP